MAIAVERYTPEELPAESRQSAIDVLDFIANLEIPEQQLSADANDFFNDYQLGRIFSAIIDTHGGLRYSSAGYNQLGGTDGEERFLATHYSGAFHVYITPNLPANEPHYTIPITIPTETGIPIATRNESGQYGRLEYGEKYDAQESMAQVRHLAALMSRVLKGIETAPGVFEVIT